MARDYFQEITPHHGGHEKHPHASHKTKDTNMSDDTTEIPIRVSDSEGRSIRNISSPRRRAVDTREALAVPSKRRRSGGSRRWLWIVAGTSVLVVGGLLLFAFRPTSITVTPKSHDVVFTATPSFVAYPAASAPSGTLPYTVQRVDLEDSVVVPALNVTASSVAGKASGSITVYNSYSPTSVKLLKNTRFESLGGLIYRTPAEIMVPGKTSSGPGQIKVTVIAEKEGSAYNIGAANKFTLPGLKSTPAMYTGVYAQSTSAMSGGSSPSDGPSLPPSVQDQAVGQIQNNLQQKALEAAVAAAGETSIVAPTLVQITYVAEPNTTEAGGGIRIRRTAHVVIPIFESGAFAQAVAAAVSADATGQSVSILPGENFSAQATGATATLGTDPLSFTLSGKAQLVWNIDIKALAEALAGRDSSAFQTIVEGFPGVAEARARIEPFWKSTFPSDATGIRVIVVAPQKAQ